MLFKTQHISNIFLASCKSIKMNHCIVAKQNCYRYFKDEVLPRLNSTFPHLQINLLTFEYPGDHCNVYFGRNLRYSSGTLQMLYDGIEISVCPFDTGNRCQDHGGTVYTPTCIRGTLLMNDRLQRDKMFFWHSLADMVDAVKSFNGE